MTGRVHGPPAAPAAPAAGTGTERNYALDVLRIVSITGVVAIHAFGQLAGSAAARGTGSWLAAAVIDIGFIWVVPVFVMISGALALSPRAQLPGPGGFYRRRAVRLLPALVFWHLVYIFVGNGLVRGLRQEPGKVLSGVFHNAVAPQLYFLWLILGLYLAAPLLARILDRAGPRGAVLVTAAVQLLVLSAFAVLAWGVQAGRDWHFPWNILTQWFPYVGYFMAGRVLAQLPVPRPAAAAVGAGAAVVSGFNVWHWIHQGSVPVLDVVTPPHYLGLGVAVAAFGIFASVFHLLRGWRPGPRLGRSLRALSNASFGVFLCHYLILLWLTFAVFPTPAAPPLALVALKFVLAAAGAFAASLLAARIPWLRAVF